MVPLKPSVIKTQGTALTFVQTNYDYFFLAGNFVAFVYIHITQSPEELCRVEITKQNCKSDGLILGLKIVVER